MTIIYPTLLQSANIIIKPISWSYIKIRKNNDIKNEFINTIKILLTLLTL